MMWDDPIIAETRSLREQVASRFNYDVLALGEYFKTKRAKDAKKLIVQAVKLMRQAQLKPHEQLPFAPKLQQPVAVSAASEHSLKELL
jgi:hypothetical protein